MSGKQIGLTEDQGDQHPQKRGIREGGKEYHQRGQCRKKSVDDDDFIDGDHRRTVLDRRYRMPDIRHYRPQKLGHRREGGTDLGNKGGKSKPGLFVLVPDLLFFFLGFLSCFFSFFLCLGGLFIRFTGIRIC